MFDGSIKPQRVIRLSGASFMAQTSINRKNQSRFDLYSSIRNKAAKKIKDSVQSRLYLKSDIKDLSLFIDSYITNVNLFFDHPNSINNYSLSNIVSYHPICRLIRLSTAILKFYPDLCTTSFKYECVKYLINWYNIQDVKYSFVFLSDNEETKHQFILLISRFVKSFFTQCSNATSLYQNFETGRLRVRSDALTEDELSFCRFIKIVISTFPYRSLVEINSYCRLSMEWYPDVLRRFILNNTNSDLNLLELHRFLKPLISDINEAFYLLVRFWSLPNFSQFSDELLIDMIKCTIHENFLIGCSGVGDNTRLVTKHSRKPKFVIDGLLHRLLKICNEKLPMDVTLNTGKMNTIRENLTEEIDSDLLDNHLHFLHYYVNDSNHPVYYNLFFNLLNLLQRLVELDIVAQKNFSKHLESIFNVLFVSFYHFPEPPNLYYLQTKQFFWTKLLCLPNLPRDLIFIIIQLLVPVHQKSHFVNDWHTYTISKVTNRINVPEICQFDLDASVANILLSGSAISTMLNLFKKHLKECCKNNILALFSHFDEHASNYSCFSSLWKIFCLLINHSLKIMYDGEIIELEDSVNPLMSVEDAIWLSKIFNYMFWYKINNKKMSEIEFDKSNFYPHAQICKCGIEVKLQGSYNYSTPNLIPSNLSQYNSVSSPSYNFSEESIEAGLLSRRFNERFYRLTGTNSDMWIIPEAEHAIMQYINNESKGDVLKILDYIPHTISFKIRLMVFYNYISKDKSTSRNPMAEFIGSSVYIIRRPFIVEDGLNTLGSLNNHQLKQVFRVLFVDENGIEEQGVDGGGLFKEFLITLCTLIFDPTYGIFEEIPEERSYYPCPNSGLIHDNHLELFCFIGKIVGKALYEQILIEPVLSRLILNLILKRRNTLDDLKLFDGTLYKNITSLRKMSDEEISSLGLTFTCTQVCFGSTFQEDIVDDGRNIKVTKDNVDTFIHQFSNFKCNRLIESQCSAFLQGLSSIIPLEWLQMFSPSELELLISGSSDAIDINDLKKNTVYAGGFDEKNDTIRWLWEILDEYNNNQRSSFLWFVTCCKRSPLMGFKQLQPPFCVHKEPDSNRLPSVSTCLNLLKLPECSSKDVLKNKIRDAMSLSKGFGLH